jgi:hypothetical protein
VPDKAVVGTAKRQSESEGDLVSRGGENYITPGAPQTRGPVGVKLNDENNARLEDISNKAGQLPISNQKMIPSRS